MTPRTKSIATRWGAGSLLSLAALVGGWNLVRRPALDAAGIARTEAVDAVRTGVDTLRTEIRDIQRTQRQQLCLQVAQARKTPWEECLTQ